MVVEPLETQLTVSRLPLIAVVLTSYKYETYTDPGEYNIEQQSIMHTNSACIQHKYYCKAVLL